LLTKQKINRYLVEKFGAFCKILKVLMISNREQNELLPQFEPQRENTTQAMCYLKIFRNGSFKEAVISKIAKD